MLSFSRKFVTVLAGLLLLLFTGCRTTQNQTVIPAEWQSYFNASPATRDYVKNNERHQVLVAVIDSGVDYNHPLIREHIHFSINSKGEAVGAGWDYVGNDAWPLPYLARTSHLYKKDKDAQKEHKEIPATIRRLLKISPALSQWLHPHRLFEDEIGQGIYHGTHVAGLSSYDDNRIGLIPYRVLPETEAIDPSLPTSIDLLYSYLEGAIEKASSAGVKVVNLSLGMTFGLSDEGADHLIEVFKKFETLVNAHPEMVFVAAAGNDNTWVNGATRFSFPCGIKATNMLCVASINENGIPSEFTNIPLIENPLIFAPGERILAPFPSQLCDSQHFEKIKGKHSEASLKKLAKNILKDCSTNKPKSVFPLSGTSMASPLIARAIALEALNLRAEATAAELIESFLSKSQKIQYGPLSMVKFKLPLPSWYPKEAPTQGLGLGDSAVTRGYFEFYIKK